MLWRSFVFSLTLRHSDLITTLTYVLMDNFCPCLTRFFTLTSKILVKMKQFSFFMFDLPIKKVIYQNVYI